MLADTNAPPLAANHWRQLWLKEHHDAWKRKSETEVLQLAEKGDAVAQFVYSQAHYNTDREKAKAMLEASAAAGLPQAIFEKAYSTFIGYQVPREARLESWAVVVQAAETGYPYARLTMAQYETGRLSSDGLIRPNVNRALEYFRYCADLGYTDAMAELALLYSSGIGEPRNESDSPHNLLRKAAQNGSSAALGHLSDRYALGHGETVDPLEAARLRFLIGGYDQGKVPGSQFTDAQGNPIAQDTVAWDNMAKALSLFVKAGRERNREAAFALAKQYQDAAKPGEAVVLLRFAKTLGSTEAEAELKKLEPTVTPEQKKLAEARLAFLRKQP